MDVRITTLIDTLAETPTSGDVMNQYAPTGQDNAIRRQNLGLYLRQMTALQPKILLLAEAPGYRGCRLTGVPVTSRSIMLTGLANTTLFGAAHGYQATSDAGFEDIQREQSATILWETLSNYPVIPLVWNTFPFHPHKQDEPRSNRTPRKSEIETGKPFIRAIHEIFQFEHTVAVGNVAYAALQDMGITCRKVRHPAQGGKRDFVAGIQEIMNLIA